jgi:hypothetical protein
MPEDPLSIRTLTFNPMKKLLLLGICSVLPACAIQGVQSFTPTGITLAPSVRLGTDAFKPNPLLDPPEPLPQINNNYYQTPPPPKVSYFRPPDVVIWETYLGED